MATAPRAFRRAAKKAVERPSVAFTLDWVEDLTPEQEAEGVEAQVIRSDTFHATQPSDERLFLIAAILGDEDGGGEPAAVLELFRDSLPRNEFRILKARLADPEDSVDLDVFKDVLEWLMEKWADFPTQQSAASSPSQTSTGTNSTGRVRGQGSTRSASPSTAS